MPKKPGTQPQECWLGGGLDCPIHQQMIIQNESILKKGLQAKHTIHNFGPTKINRLVSNQTRDIKNKVM